MEKFLNRVNGDHFDPAVSQVYPSIQQAFQAFRQLQVSLDSEIEFSVGCQSENTDVTLEGSKNSRPSPVPVRGVDDHPIGQISSKPDF